MPELPEVETTRRGIEPYLKGQTITEITVRQPKLRWPVPEVLMSLSGVDIGTARDLLMALLKSMSALSSPLERGLVTGQIGCTNQMAEWTLWDPGHSVALRYCNMNWMR